MGEWSYLPGVEEDRTQMLKAMGMKDIKELFADIPAHLQLNRPYQLNKPASEWELMQEFGKLASANVNVDQAVSFLGAGAYDHFIPSVVPAVVSRSEFYTAYTPYQPEISQGILQAIFEYQTMTAELFGLDVSNASVYDGPTALGEAALMACTHTRRDKVLVSSAVNPEYRKVLTTYASGQRIEVVEVPQTGGVTDLERLAQMVSEEVGAVVVGYPNFFGHIEELDAIAHLAHQKGALFIVSTYPVALGLLEAPGHLGADIVVAEGQSLGNPLSYGGPYLGMMATTSALMRRLPGRIAGQTKDRGGRRGFVLTLQAREQHIRREKASSNICSNQALNALAATVYLSSLGPKGFAELARQNYSKAHYALQRFLAAGAKRVYQQPYFNEFIITFEEKTGSIYRELLDDRIFFGYPLKNEYPEIENGLLVAVTETMTKSTIDAVATRLEGLL